MAVASSATTTRTPAAITGRSTATARTLERLGLKPSEIAGRLFGGIEAKTAGQTHPDGPKELERLDDQPGSRGRDHRKRGWGA